MAATARMIMRERMRNWGASILVPRAHNPFGLRQGSRAPWRRPKLKLVATNVLLMQEFRIWNNITLFIYLLILFFLQTLMSAQLPSPSVT